jgi:hypothetical protein
VKRFEKVKTRGGLGPDARRASGSTSSRQRIYVVLSTLGLPLTARAVAAGGREVSPAISAPSTVRTTPPWVCATAEEQERTSQTAPPVPLRPGVDFRIAVAPAVGVDRERDAAARRRREAEVHRPPGLRPAIREDGEWELAARPSGGSTTSSTRRSPPTTRGRSRWRGRSRGSRGRSSCSASRRTCRSTPRRRTGPSPRDGDDVRQ